MVKKYFKTVWVIFSFMLIFWDILILTKQD